MEVGTYVECPVCKKTYLVRFEKPKHFQPSVVRHQCTGACKAKYRTTFSLIPGVKESLKQEHEIIGMSAETVPFMVEKGILQKVVKEEANETPNSDSVGQAGQREDNSSERTDQGNQEASGVVRE